MNTIKVLKEGLLHTPCPINNGADLQSGEMLGNLFDEGQYIENKVYGKYVALGFIGGLPARCEYELGANYLRVIALHKNCLLVDDILPERLADEQVFPKIYYLKDGNWTVYFYYRNAD